MPPISQGQYPGRVLSPAFPALDESEHVLSYPPGAVPTISTILQSLNPRLFGIYLCLELMEFLEM